MASRDLEMMRDIIKEDPSEFYYFPINVQARDDFKYLCGETNFYVAFNVNYFTLSRTKNIGDFFVVGYNTEKSSCEVPQKYINVAASNLHVAFVLYKGSNVQDVYIVPAAEFGGKKFFGPLKISKTDTSYKVSIKSSDKMHKYSFGVVLNTLV